MTPFPQGVCPILPTPFSEDGEVDYDSLKTLSRGLVDMKVSALTMFGIASEYYKLSDDERAEMTDVVVECVAGDVPVIASVTRHATELAVKEARQWQEAGADLLMLLPPFFLKPGADTFVQHVEAVRTAVDVPIIVQYAPEQTGVAISAETFVDMTSRLEGLALKIENKPPGRLVSTLVERTNGEVPIYVGNAGFQLLEGLERGATGVMPGASMSDVYIDIIDLFRAQEFAEARRVHTRLLGVLNVIRQNVEQIIRCEKMILVKRGLIASSYCRKPTFTLDAVYQQEFDTYVQEAADLIGL